MLYPLPPPPLPPDAEIVVIDCVPEATDDVPPPLLLLPPEPTVADRVLPGVRPVKYLTAVPPLPPPEAPQLEYAVAAPLPPPPTTVTFTAVTFAGIVNVPDDVKT